MNKDKVYLGGYVVGHTADTLGYKGLQIQLENMDIVEIDENLVHKGINEPHKVTVPQFVADWYEEHKDDLEIALFRCIDHIPSVYDEGDLNEFEEWIIDGETKPFQTLVNMHQFGYEVKEEKRYKVNLKNGQPLVKTKTGKTIYLCFNQDIIAENYKFTRKELEEAGFSDVFNSPLFEVEEVE